MSDDFLNILNAGPLDDPDAPRPGPLPPVPTGPPKPVNPPVPTPPPGGGISGTQVAIIAGGSLLTGAVVGWLLMK